MASSGELKDERITVWGLGSLLDFLASDLLLALLALSLAFSFYFLLCLGVGYTPS